MAGIVRKIYCPSLDPNSSCVLIGVERGKVPLQLFRITRNLVTRVFRHFGQRGNAGKTLGTSI